jgi:hypothetical protein
VTRAELHRLVDALPDDAVNEAALLLERAADPMRRHLDAAPVDDEPDSVVERAEADAAWAAHERGAGLPLSELVAETRR